MLSRDWLLNTLKFLPALQPAAISGVVRQSGPLGAFSRSGRTPVDPRRLSQIARRSGFSLGSKSWRYLSAADRAAYAALSPSSSSGVGVVCGRTAVSSFLPALLPPDIPPVAYPGAPSLEFVSIIGSEVILKALFVGTGSDGLLCYFSGARPGTDFASGRFVAIDYLLGPGPGAYDLSIGFASVYGVPRVGDAYWCFTRATSSGLVGPDSNMLTVIAS